MSRITLIAFHFGKPPAWLWKFIERLEANPCLSCVLLGDQVGPSRLSRNLVAKRITLDEFLETCTRRLGFPVRRNHPYAVCDLRPAFGKIFGEYLADSQWWGWCDLDIVLGRVASFLTPERLEQYDVISGASYCADGPFCILRNTPELVELFDARPLPQHPEFPYACPSIKHASAAEMFADPNFNGWGEWGFTQQIEAAESRGELRKCFEHWQSHDRLTPPAGCQLIGEHLVETPSGREILYYHFPGAKAWPL